MSPFSEPPRNIVFFGETGAGKSSIINLLLGTRTFARVSHDSSPCTQVATSYETTLNGVKYTLWDTRGLGGHVGFLRNVFKLAASSEKELKKFLKERHQRHEIDLLVYCVRGSRSTKASAKYYDTFCVTTRQLVAPVVILVTHLERERSSMEEWWKRNAPGLEKLKMEFDDHACITTLPGDPRSAESRERLVDLITTKRRWQAQRSGSYFGTPVKTSMPPPLRGGLTRGLFRMQDKKLSGGALTHGPRNNPGSISAADSTRSVSYYTAEPFGSPVSSGPVVGPPSPRSATAERVRIPSINTNVSGVNVRSQSSREEISSLGSW